MHTLAITLWLFSLVIGAVLQRGVSGNGDKIRKSIIKIVHDAATSIFTKNRQHKQNLWYTLDSSSESKYNNSSYSSFKDDNNTSNETTWDYIESIASLLLSDDTLDAVNTIRTILSSVQSEHGVVIDVFGRYKRRDILASVLALSRLQHASHYYEWHANNEKRNLEHDIPTANQHNINNILREERELIEDLAHYSIYANVAYGWKMDLAFRRRLHLGGNDQALLRRTGISVGDVIKLQWESRAHRPAYFCVRDRKRKAVVLCIRGTWSAHDLLTDLCCAPEKIDLNVTNEDYTLSQHGTKYKRNHQISAHGGMLKAARLVQEDVQNILRSELQSSGPDFSLVLVGHSMGGSVAAVLGTLFENEFPGRKLRVYTYGASCISPINTKLFHNVVSVINDGDPFRSISLGHIADISVALSQLCEDPHLRNQVLLRTNAAVRHMEADDLEWCYHTMKQLRGLKAAEKFFPPGRIFLLTEILEQDSSRLLSTIKHPVIREVPPEFFEDLLIGARMFDLSRHIPSLYESQLRRLVKAVDLIIF